MRDLDVPESDELTLEKKYHLLLRVSEKLSGTPNLDELLSHLIDTIRSVVAYDAAGIFVVTDSGLTVKRNTTTTSMIESMIMRGFPIRAEFDPMLDLGEGIVGYVIRTGESVVVPDAELDQRYVEGRPQTKSEITVPIKLNERVIGALNLESDRTNTFTEADLEVLQFYASIAAVSIEKSMLQREMIEKKRIESQLEVARQVQASLLPSDAPVLPGYDIAAVNLPTYEVGGDYYDYIPLPKSQVGIAVADVSGKGVPAALIMSMFRAALRTQVRNDTALSHVMEVVNLLLCESTSDAQFVTAVYGVLDAATHRFDYANCGHNPPLLVRADAPVEHLDQGGMALGLFDTAHYEEASVSLVAGDVLALYTDGVVEAANAGGEEFGTHRLEQMLLAARRLPAREIVQAVIKATRNFSGEDFYQDDFTIVVIKR